MSLFSHLRELVEPLTWLQSFGLGNLMLAQNLESLSWNSRSRLILSKNLRHAKPDRSWLIFDQPFAGLPTEDTRFCLRKVREAVTKGMSFVFSTHDQGIIEICDWVVEV